MEPSEIVELDWHEVYELIEKLGRWSSGQGFKEIVAVGTGGLIPGVVLSHVLGLPMKPMYAKSSVDGIAVEQFKVYVEFPYLVVDDIIDTGQTMGLVAKMFRAGGATFSTVSLLYKARSRYKPRFYVEKVENDVMVVFPWEKKETELKRWREFNERRAEERRYARNSNR